MSFGVDTLGALIEKLKQLVNETQNNYESFFDATQLFKQGKMNDKEYFSMMGEYLVSSSALNFLSCRVILEIKSTLDKGASKKGGSSTPRSSFPSSSSSSSFQPSSNTLPSSGGTQTMGDSGGTMGAGGFGVDGFISSGGSVGSQSNEQYDLPMPQEVPTYRPVDIIVSRQDSSNSNGSRKNCIVCAASIPKHAKFCSKCGNSQ